MAETDLPTKWREAVPYVIWIVLVLGFGLEFTTNLIHGNWLLAFLSFCAMAGLMAVTLHWSRLHSWAATLNPNWVVGTLACLLIVIALSPFVEEKRWPFSSSDSQSTLLGSMSHQATPDVIGLEAQKAVLIEWLQQTHRERDAAPARAMDLDQQLGSMGLFTQKLSVIDLWAAANLYWGGKELINRLRKHDVAVLITAPPASEIFGDYINSTVNAASLILDTEHPEQKTPASLFVRRPSEVDLDAPKIPPPEFNGVVIHDVHGEIQQAIEGLLNRMKRCLIIKNTKRTIEGLAEYYKRDVIWVEIGKWPLWNNTCAS